MKNNWGEFVFIYYTIYIFKIFNFINTTLLSIHIFIIIKNECIFFICRKYIEYIIL